LTLSKTGAVRDANVISGPKALRAPAIKVAKARKYKHRVVYSFPDPHEMTVEVNFPQDSSGTPEIRQALPAGVSSCIPFPTVVRISPQVMQSHLLKHVEPVFPAETQAVEGTFVLRLRVDKDGNVYNVEKIKGPDASVAPVIEAVKAWKYEPYLLEGAPIEVETTVELRFPN
jgi:TonB-like protein